MSEILNLRSSRTKQPRSSLFKQRKKNYVQVTNFLLGGNINDPLNLSSIDPNEPNQKTPVCSPKQESQCNNNEIDILIPVDINDPLKLNSIESKIKTSSELCHLLISPKKIKTTNKRKRTESDSIVSDLIKEDSLKRMNLGFNGLNAKDELMLASNRMNRQINSLNQKNYIKRNAKIKDTYSKSTMNTKSSNQQLNTDSQNKQKPFIFQSNQNQFYYAKGRKFNLKDQKFQYGNYNRYYGYRNQNYDQDLRLLKFKKEWFIGKDVLDIGCNVGYITCQLARDFKPKKIVGLDIDNELIKSARRNIQHYLESKIDDDKCKKKNDFPISLPICYGPLSETNKDDDNKITKCDNEKEDDKCKIQESTNQFPNNIQFVAANYILPNDQLLINQKPEYDCILCLSVTKWVHLNFGDNGLKRMFKRIHKQLKLDGILILESQPIWSYKRKKALTETTLKNYNSIKFKPDQFKDYLLSDEIGFRSCEIIDTPNHKSKGFQRPILIFRK